MRISEDQTSVNNSGLSIIFNADFSFSVMAVYSLLFQYYVQAVMLILHLQIEFMDRFILLVP